MNHIDLGLQLMAYGLFGIFTVCAVFILVIKGIMKFFPYKPEVDDHAYAKSETGRIKHEQSCVS